MPSPPQGGFQECTHQGAVLFISHGTQSREPPVALVWGDPEGVPRALQPSVMLTRQLLILLDPDS